MNIEKLMNNETVKMVQPVVCLALTNLSNELLVRYNKTEKILERMLAMR